MINRFGMLDTGAIFGRFDTCCCFRRLAQTRQLNAEFLAVARNLSRQGCCNF